MTYTNTIYNVTHEPHTANPHGDLDSMRSSSAYTFTAAHTHTRLYYPQSDPDTHTHAHHTPHTATQPRPCPPHQCHTTDPDRILSTSAINSNTIHTSQSATRRPYNTCSPRNSSRSPRRPSSVVRRRQPPACDRQCAAAALYTRLGAKLI